MVRRRALLMMGALATAGGLVGLIATRDAPHKPAVFKPVVPTRIQPPGTRAPDARGAAAMPPWNIVTTVVVYTDPSRGTPARGAVQPQPVRNFETVIRWPVTPAGDLIPGRLPVVVFAHGYAVQTSTYAALLDDMAAAGMIVAAPELPGESAALLGSPNEADLVNEPCDFEFVAAVDEQSTADLHVEFAGVVDLIAGESLARNRERVDVDRPAAVEGEHQAAAEVGPQRAVGSDHLGEAVSGECLGIDDDLIRIVFQTTAGVDLDAARADGLQPARVGHEVIGVH